MGASHDNHATMHHLWHLISRPPSRQAWDLGVPTLIPFNHANTSLIAPQCSYTYLFSFPTRRLIVCTPVPSSHPHPLLLHVDSCLSYRYPLVSIPTSHLCLRP